MGKFLAGSVFAILAIVCTLAIFLFPAVRGPYAATHGPVSPLENVRAWQWIALFLALTSFASLRSGCALKLLLHVSLDGPSSFHGSSREQTSILRC